MTDRLGTSDLYDIHQESLESCDLQLRQLGGVRHFEGPIVTFRAFEDNLELKKIVAEPGEGQVIVVDTDGSMRVAMLGDNMAALAARNGWAGIVVNGAVRDTAALADLPIGVKALGSNPRRSRKEGVGHRDVVVTFGGAAFTPGAYLVSDDDGIVTFPLGVVPGD
ncbi:ribonuclease E activity regulator RraA [Nocardioides albus]|uniref:4-hydroxy-4-methyl-2-oxoglutarate aldolase n=1 Tax=Nocardioides albus TaxID=1841 RepID=A0A7W5F7D9_9ACTN|nr:ribonuclease E activity regulator RraA [Nocardioides albus]MBB3088013.1 regulator of ribonuclease activity A [Nocardioides albus]GGU21989.1 putative 4-hydroxy-4-methyl-2-oxoglutarate aldolase [Nocardioides albus]